MLQWSLVVAICCLAANLILGAPPSGQGQNTTRPERFTGIPKLVNVSIRWQGGDNNASFRTFTVPVEPFELVLDLKRKIFGLEGYPYARQRLYLGEQQLHDDVMVAQYGALEPGRVVLLKISEWNARGLIDLVVHQAAIGQPPVTITTRLARTVASFKEELARMAGGQQPPQRLVLWGKELRDERRLFEYRLSNGSVLDLGWPLEACRSREASISLRVLSGAKLTITGVNLAGTVAELKERIERETGVARQFQLLVFNATYLQDPNILCDHLGLEWDSPPAIYMMLHSSLVTWHALVAQIEPPVATRTATGDPHLGPVLRENALESQAPAAILSDKRNWAFSGLVPAVSFMVEFDPTARLVPCPGSRVAMERAREKLRNMEKLTHLGNEVFNASLLLQRASIRIASSLRPVCPPWTRSRWELSEETGDCELAGYGIELSGRGDWFARASAGRTTGSHLGSDLTNYVPDAFEDSEITFSFELAERVREQLARDEQPTADGAPQLRPQLGLARLREINQMVMLAYLQAMAGINLPQDGDQLEAGPDEECALCHDELISERALKLSACGHAYHEDCLLQWMPQMYKQFEHSICPYCREPFRLRIEVLMRDVELK